MIKLSHVTAMVSGVAIGALAFATAGLANGLSGKVSSEVESTMEGVIVSAKREGSTITTSVVTDASGQYSFPADRLGAGNYRLSVRAVGYVLDGPKTVDVPADKSGSADLKLSKTKNLAAQLSNGEWLLSMPGSDRDKIGIDGCSGCHSYQRIVNSNYDADGFREIFQRMSTYFTGSMPTKPQVLLPGPHGIRHSVNDAAATRLAEFLAKANLSETGQHNYELKTYPRPKGRATKVIYTEFDLPAKDWEPHDVIIDREGMVWFSDFGDQRMGRMDPKTGNVETIKLPLMKDDGSPKGGLEIAEAPNGDVWVAGMYQGGLYQWQRSTGKVIPHKLPNQFQTTGTQQSMVSPQHSDVDGYVWTNNQQDHALLRLSLKTGEFEHMGVPADAAGKPILGYGMPTDLKNHPIELEFGGTSIGVFDPDKKVTEIFATPSTRSAPRRGRVDAQGRLWFAEYKGNAVAMFDPQTKKITEFPMPTKWSAPYDAVATKNGEVWSGSMSNDMVNRLDPKTGNVVDYLLPHPTNIRRVFVDDKGPRQALWVGNNHGAAIVKVEPLD